MDTHDNHDTVVRMRPKSTLLGDPKPPPGVASPPPGGVTASPEERDDPLPRPGDAYRAYARRLARPIPTLFLVSRDYLPNGFSYANLERVWLEQSDKPGMAPLLIARFYGSVVTEAVIEGRDLHSLCHGIGRHVIPWMWEHPSPKDFANDDEPLIRRISIRQAKG